MTLENTSLVSKRFKAVLKNHRIGFAKALRNGACLRHFGSREGYGLSSPAYRSAA